MMQPEDEIPRVEIKDLTLYWKDEDTIKWDTFVRRSLYVKEFNSIRLILI